MDRGGEFLSNVFRNHCIENGIKQEFTCSYTPQQNGVSERLNLTILNKTRAMFIDSKLPKYLWGEAVRTAVYQLNRTPCKAINFRVPAEIYLGKLDLSKLRIFGAKAWYCVLPRTDKLQPRAREARMVGYTGSGYRLWDPETEKIIVSRDVTFDETQFVYSPKNTQYSNIPTYYQHTDVEHTESEEEVEQIQNEAVTLHKRNKHNKTQILE